MQCAFPNHGYYINGEWWYQGYSVNELAKNPKDNNLRMIRKGWIKFKEKVDKITLFPCGRCLICKINKTIDWKVRAEFERRYYNNTLKAGAIFITLTYNKKNLPEKNSLKKADVQKFMKRVRKECGEQKIKVPLKYLGCGEYGTKGTKRPHYHMIIFGLNLDNKDIIEKCWKMGHIDVKQADENAGSYVAGYTLKKVYGKAASKAEYTDKGRIAPYIMVSKGLGLREAEKMKKKIRERKYIKLKRTIYRVPRYLKNKLFTAKEIWKITEELVGNVYKEQEELIKEIIRKETRKTIKEATYILCKQIEQDNMQRLKNQQRKSELFLRRDKVQ